MNSTINHISNFIGNETNTYEVCKDIYNLNFNTFTVILNLTSAITVDIAINLPLNILTLGCPSLSPFRLLFYVSRATTISQVKAEVKAEVHAEVTELKEEVAKLKAEVENAKILSQWDSNPQPLDSYNEVKAAECAKRVEKAKQIVGSIYKRWDVINQAGETNCEGLDLSAQPADRDQLINKRAKVQVDTAAPKIELKKDLEQTIKEITKAQAAQAALKIELQQQSSRK